MTTPDTNAIRAQMEALTGFTAGPWRDEDGVIQSQTTVWQNGVKQAGWDYAAIRAEVTDDWDQAANARLIAAAPDMRTTILALCDALDAANAEARLLRSAVTHAHADVHDLLGVATDDEADAILAAWSRIGRALPDTDAQVIDKLRTEVERLRTALAQKGEE